ncbi:MAG: FAD-dependent oxidoreductase [Burkholderiaceae bacterium]
MSIRKVERSADRILTSDIFEGTNKAIREPRNGVGTWLEPARELPVYHRCDVLVIGGGPAGTAAARAAAREGAEVTLVERYNHLGGLATGGLVIWIDRMSDWSGKPVIRGVAEEILDRLPADAVAGPARDDWGSRDEEKVAHWSMRTAAYHGVVTWSPTLDPERLKLLSQDMLLEHKVRLVYHAWASMPIVEDNTVKGVVFESKEGRQAIMAGVVIDATGDGDLFSRAGEQTEHDIEADDVHHCVNTACLMGGVDMDRFISFRSGQPEAFSQFMRGGRESCGLFERAFVSWRNDIALFMGPRQSGYNPLNVDELSEVDIRSHQAMPVMLDYYRRNAPGFENAYLMLSAPQIGVRHSRRVVGKSKIVRAQWPTEMVHVDEVGVTPSVNPKWPNISIPLGAMIPARLDGLLAPGRHLSCDPNSHGFMREIPQCWVTGQATGVAAVAALRQGVQPREVDTAVVQSMLREQGVFLRTPVEAREQGLPMSLNEAAAKDAAGRAA